MSKVITTAIGSARLKPHAQHPHQRGEVDDAGQHEAEPLHAEQVEQVDGHEHREGAHLRRAMQNHSGHSTQGTGRPALRARWRTQPLMSRIAPQMPSPTATAPGNSARADLLARDLRKALYVQEQRTGEHQQHDAPDGVVELHGPDLLGDADGLHRRAQVGVGLGHEGGEFVRPEVDHAEAAAAHELGVVLARGDLLDRSGQLVARLGRQCPSAPRCRARRRSSSRCRSPP